MAAEEEASRCGSSPRPRGPTPPMLVLLALLQEEEEEEEDSRRSR